MGYIYMLTNTINKKVYVGQTKKTIEERFRDHKYACKAGKKYVIYHAMRKYGVENFNVELLEECSNAKLNEREIYWIGYWNATEKECGYNMSEGGNRQDQHPVQLNPEEIVQLFNSGYSARKLRDMYHTSIDNVTAILKERNISYGVDKQRLDEEIEVNAIVLYKRGYSSTQIAKFLKINKSTVLKVLKRNNITTRSFTETKNLERNLPTLSTRVLHESLAID